MVDICDIWPSEPFVSHIFGHLGLIFLCSQVPWTHWRETFKLELWHTKMIENLRKYMYLLRNLPKNMTKWSIFFNCRPSWWPSWIFLLIWSVLLKLVDMKAWNWRHNLRKKTNIFYILWLFEYFTSKISAIFESLPENFHES